MWERNEKWNEKWLWCVSYFECVFEYVFWIECVFESTLKTYMANNHFIKHYHMRSYQNPTMCLQQASDPAAMTVCRLSKRWSDHTLSASVGEQISVPYIIECGAIVCVGVLLHAVQKVTGRWKVVEAEETRCAWWHWMLLGRLLDTGAHWLARGWLSSACCISQCRF